ncbi:MAG: hypothetical protein ACOZQL_10775 [Myxococcota bacterium]
MLKLITCLLFGHVPHAGVSKSHALAYECCRCHELVPCVRRTSR